MSAASDGLGAKASCAESWAWLVLGCVLLAGLIGTCAHGSVSDVSTQAMRAPTLWAVVSVDNILPAEQAPSTPAAGST